MGKSNSWKPISTAPKNKKILVKVEVEDGFDYSVVIQDENGFICNDSSEYTFEKSYLYEPVFWKEIEP